MTTTKKKRWWPRWRRQQSAPRRLERTKSDFGYKCVNTIYKTLFPEIFRGEGLNTIAKIRASNCFENGAFVFADPGAQLFNILLGSTDIPGTDRQFGILRGRKGWMVGSSRTPLSHLIPQLLKQQGPKNDWSKIQFSFYESDGRIKTISTSSHLGNVLQYERIIDPPIKFLCNPQCETPPSPSFCHELNIGKKLTERVS